MKALEAGQWAIHVVGTIVIALDYRDEWLEERQVKDPVHKDDHDAQKLHHLLNVVLAVLQEVIHEKEQANHSHQVDHTEEHEGPVEEDRLWWVDSFYDSAVAAQVDDKI